MFFVHTGHANFDFNWCSIFTKKIFNFKNSSNGQNHSSSGSHHLIKKILPSKISDSALFWDPPPPSPHSLTFGKPCKWKLKDQKVICYKTIIKYFQFPYFFYFSSDKLSKHNSKNVFLIFIFWFILSLSVTIIAQKGCGFL